MDPKSTPNHRKCISSPTNFTVSVVGNFHAIPWLGDYFLCLESICAWHPPKYTIYAQSQDQGWSADVKGSLRMVSWLSQKVKAEHDTPPYYPYMEENEHLEGHGWSPDHLACLPLSLILVWDFEKETSEICTGLFGIYI